MNKAFQAFFFNFTIILILVYPQLSYSLTIKDAPTKELATESELIVWGKIVSVTCEWEDNKHQAINTFITIDVEEYIKGNGSGDIVVKQLGGTIGDISDIIVGTPVLKPGEEVVLFLLKHNDDFVIHSIALGCYKIVKDENSQEYAVNNLQNVNLIDPQSNSKMKFENKIKSFQSSSFIAEIRSYNSSQ